MADELSPAARERLDAWLKGGFLPGWAMDTLNELQQTQAWEELEDRFFRDLSFGTGGMRGRVIGRQPAPTELGPGGVKQPAHPAIGANTLNDVTVARATMGLFHSVKAAGVKNAKPRLVIAHDVRHFSRRFAELAARVWSGLGGETWLFDGPRSTPQLSFTVRVLGADAGIVLTASHNPPHDNGYKVYASHGGQVVPPLADQIVKAVRAVKLPEVGPMLQQAAVAQATAWKTIPRELEDKYVKAAAEVVLDAAVIAKMKPKIVYSALHGTGGVVIPGLLRKLGAELFEVVEQSKLDANFSTVRSPNPEDAGEPGRDVPYALRMAYADGNKFNADAVLATDPDADRIGTAFRKSPTEREELTGNELGVLLAEYRLRRAKELGWLPMDGSSHAVVLKTFVTTPMLDALARAHGVSCVNTLTGFKWMGSKLFKYERQLFTTLAQAGDKRIPEEFAALPSKDRAALYLKHSKWMVFAAEESYGCLAGDAVRDKDANAASAMCAELAAWLSTQNKTAPELLSELYVQHGYHAESLHNLPFEGATGVAQMRRALASLRSQPPASLGGIAVERVNDFLLEHRDEEGDLVPREDFLLYNLAGGWRCAIRASGTEPKLKIYFFIREPLARTEDLNALKIQLKPKFDAWINAVVADIRARALAEN